MKEIKKYNSSISEAMDYYYWLKLLTSNHKAKGSTFVSSTSVWIVV